MPNCFQSDTCKSLSIYLNTWNQGEENFVLLGGYVHMVKPESHLQTVILSGYQSKASVPAPLLPAPLGDSSVPANPRKTGRKSDLCFSHPSSHCPLTSPVEAQGVCPWVSQSAPGLSLLQYRVLHARFLMGGGPTWAPLLKPAFTESLAEFISEASRDPYDWPFYL